MWNVGTGLDGAEGGDEPEVRERRGASFGDALKEFTQQAPHGVRREHIGTHCYLDAAYPRQLTKWLESAFPSYRLAFHVLLLHPLLTIIKR